MWRDRNLRFWPKADTASEGVNIGIGIYRGAERGGGGGGLFLGNHYSGLPITRTFKGNRKTFDLSGV